jgi:hypothetical protein
VKRSCCSARGSSLQAASRAGNRDSVSCTCHAKNMPQPQTPSNDSRSQKEQSAATSTSGIAPLAMPPADIARTSATDFTFYPLSALQRCGALCRFLI